MLDGNPKRYLLEVLLAVLELGRRIVLALLGRSPLALAEAGALLKLCQSLVERPGQIKREYLANVVRTMKQYKFLTNHIVQISGGFQVRGRELEIDAYDPIGLEHLEFLVLLVLGEHAQKIGTLTAVNAARASTFLTVKAILDELDRKRTAAPNLDAQWPDFTEQDIRKAISSMRDKITKTTGNDLLIENGGYGLGYRLSTPPDNVIITLRGREDPEDFPPDSRENEPRADN